MKRLQAPPQHEKGGEPLLKKPRADVSSGDGFGVGRSSHSPVVDGRSSFGFGQFRSPGIDGRSSFGGFDQFHSPVIDGRFSSGDGFGFGQFHPSVIDGRSSFGFGQFYSPGIDGRFSSGDGFGGFGQFRSPVIDGRSSFGFGQFHSPVVDDRFSSGDGRSPRSSFGGFGQFYSPGIHVQASSGDGFGVGHFPRSSFGFDNTASSGDGGRFPHSPGIDVQASSGVDRSFDDKLLFCDEAFVDAAFDMLVKLGKYVPYIGGLETDKKLCMKGDIDPRVFFGDCYEHIVSALKNSSGDGVGGQSRSSSLSPGVSSGAKQLAKSSIEKPTKKASSGETTGQASLSSFFKSTNSASAEEASGDACYVCGKEMVGDHRYRSNGSTNGNEVCNADYNFLHIRKSWNTVCVNKYKSLFMEEGNVYQARIAFNDWLDTTEGKAANPNGVQKDVKSLRVKRGDTSGDNCYVCEKKIVGHSRPVPDNPSHRVCNADYGFLHIRKSWNTMCINKYKSLFMEEGDICKARIAFNDWLDTTEGETMNPTGAQKKVISWKQGRHIRRI